MAVIKNKTGELVYTKKICVYKTRDFHLYKLWI